MVEVEPLHDDADEEATVEGSNAPAPDPVAEKKAPSPPKSFPTQTFSLLVSSDSRIPSCRKI